MRPLFIRVSRRGSKVVPKVVPIVRDEGRSYVFGASKVVSSRRTMLDDVLENGFPRTPIRLWLLIKPRGSGRLGIDSHVLPFLTAKYVCAPALRAPLRRTFARTLPRKVLRKVIAAGITEQHR